MLELGFSPHLSKDFTSRHSPALAAGLLCCPLLLPHCVCLFLVPLFERLQSGTELLAESQCIGKAPSASAMPDTPFTWWLRVFSSWTDATARANSEG